MITVMEQAAALAEAIRQSDVYTAMVSAEEALRADSAAMAALKAYEEAEKQMSRTLRESANDNAALARASRDYIAADAAVQAVPLIAAFRQRRKAFDDMLQSVNQVISERVNLGSDDPLPVVSPCAGCGKH